MNILSLCWSLCLFPARYGAVVKWLRRYPFTVESRVRLPPASPYGRVAQRQLRGAVNPLPYGFIGSSPISPTNNMVLQFNRLERRPVTPMVGVRFPLESPYYSVCVAQRESALTICGNTKLNDLLWRPDTLYDIAGQRSGISLAS